MPALPSFPTAVINLVACLFPKCSHDESNYSFPQTKREPNGELLTKRTCKVCGHVRLYDFDRMCFLSRSEEKEAYATSVASSPLLV